MCVCSLRYPACNARAPYCHLWSALLYNIFPHHLKNCTIHQKKKQYLNVKSVFWISLQLLSEKKNSHSNKNWARYDQKCISVLTVRYPIFLSGFHKPWIFSAALKIQKFRISLNPSSGTELFHADRQTDRQHGEADSCVSQFCDCAVLTKRPGTVTSCDAAQDIGLQYMYVVRRDTQCGFTQYVFYLALRFQLYMFRTSSVHPQELLCRYRICRLWYVVIRVLLDTSSWYQVVGRTIYILQKWYTDFTVSSIEFHFGYGP